MVGHRLDFKVLCTIPDCLWTVRLQNKEQCLKRRHQLSQKGNTKKGWTLAFVWTEECFPFFFLILEPGYQIFTTNKYSHFKVTWQLWDQSCQGAHVHRSKNTFKKKKCALLSTDNLSNSKMENSYWQVFLPPTSLKPFHTIVSYHHHCK